MTNEEASLLITQVLCEINKWGHSPTVFTPSFDEALKLCSNALGKQIPMRPGVCGRERYCTVCATKTSRRIVMFWEKYCPDCGQAIDWSEVSDND